MKLFMKYQTIVFFFSSLATILIISGCHNVSEKVNPIDPPNILILMSDNHSADHLGCYGDPSVKTPHIDRLASEGVLFSNAFCAAPSCSPARAAMLTGQDIWRLGTAANLWSGFPKMDVYPQMMEENGYHVGIQGKGWGPGDAQPDGWTDNPGGKRYGSFEEFYNEKESNQPWLFWYSSRDPHRPFRSEGWNKSGIDLESIEVPPYLPNHIDVKKDMADYYHEVQLFDQDVANYLALLDEMGETENTMVIVCSDNGWQMPRGLANLYDFGSKIPLIVWWPKQIEGNRKIDDFVNLNDLAPTFLELANIEAPSEMTAKSLKGLLFENKEGTIDPSRNFVVTGRERHAYVRSNGLGYPGRALRTEDFLYIRNYEPDRWPAGDPPLYGDVDSHMLHYPAPTKLHLLVHKENPSVEPLFELSFGKRPFEELYDLKKDPYQLVNVAGLDGYAEIKNNLSHQLTEYLITTNDPREINQSFTWDTDTYFKEGDKRPKPSQEAIELLDLEEEYDYTTDNSNATSEN
ncbi:MAG: sulfatase [Flavobacteriaceae bacterium]|nr:sulfatase [Flavobacteriaceae bacterium]